MNLQTHTPHLKTSNASTDEPFDHNAYLKDWSNQLQRELTSERPRISAKEYAKQRSDGIPIFGSTFKTSIPSYRIDGSIGK